MALVPSGLPTADTNQVASIKLMLDIAQSDTTKDQLLTMLYNGADTGVRTYLRRGPGQTVFATWPEQCTDTIYLTGQNTNILIFPLRPLVSVTSIYEDPQGYGGAGTNPFPASTLLTAGINYYVVNDDGATISSKGEIRRISGLNSGGMWGTYGWFPAGGIGGWSTNGPLAMGGRDEARWLSFPQGLKITATVGFATIPYDLQAATRELTIFLYNTRKFGGMMYTSESLSQYSYSLLTNPKIPELGTMRQQLARYRSDIPI